MKIALQTIDLPVTIGRGSIVHIGWENEQGGVEQQVACGAAAIRSGVSRAHGGQISCKRCLAKREG